MLYIHCISSGKELVNSHNLHKYHKGFHKVVRCFSNVFTNILFASEVPTIPSRYAVNLIKGNREAWMHRIGSLLLRDSMGITDMLHLALYQHCTMTLAASCTCFFFGSLMVTVELPQMPLFAFGIWLIRLIGLMGLFPRFQYHQKLENEFQLPSSASSLAASTKGSTAVPCALRQSF